MRLRVHRQASAELEAAATWYENEQTGLGGELLAEVSRALSIIAVTPETWPMIRPRARLRRFLLSRFPYVIIYERKEDELRVFAYGHTKRRPGYWRDRRIKGS